MEADNRQPVQPQRDEDGLSSRMIFSDEAIHFSRAGGGDHTVPRKPLAAAPGFDVDGQRSRFVRSQYGPRNPSWNLDGGSQSEGSDGEDDDDVDDDNDDLDEGDHLVSLDENNNVKTGDNSIGSVQSSSEKQNGTKARSLQERQSIFGLSRGITVKDGSLNEQQQHQQHERVGNYENTITVVQPEFYSAQMMNGGDASSSKELRRENGYGFGGRKEVSTSVDPGESLRTHLSDPVTGILMDDAMILPCGHSFGTGGMQHVSRMRACWKCLRPISENLVRPNLALRSAVQAFHREEESLSSKVPKRKTDRFEQEKCGYDDPYPMDSRGKGVQFPFVISDRVIIKGNKRTPQHFVGRVAVVTTQCLNGWYVVKTLDNGESVKLQYRSLAKVPDDPPPTNAIQSKPLAPNWLKQ